MDAAEYSADGPCQWKAGRRYSQQRQAASLLCSLLCSCSSVTDCICCTQFPSTDSHATAHVRAALKLSALCYGRDATSSMGGSLIRAPLADCDSNAFRVRDDTRHKPVIGLRDHYGVGDRWAMTQLSASGEDVVGRIRCPQYLLLARTLLLGRPGAGLPRKWWALRTLAQQQRILSGPAAALQTDIERLTAEVRLLNMS